MSTQNKITGVLKLKDMDTEELKTMLTEAHEAGNINKVIKLTVQNFKQIDLKPEWIRKIVKYMDSCPADLSEETVGMLEVFNAGEHAEYAQHIDKKIEQVKAVAGSQLLSQSGEREPGSALFPAVAREEGSIYKLKLFQNRTNSSALKSLSQNEFNWLNNAGLALFSFLEVKTGRCILWDPSGFSYSIYDTFGREDNEIEGDSLGISMLMSLFSLMTDNPVPGDIIATGSVNNRGKISPVSSMEKKLEVVTRERDCIKKVVIAENQELPDTSHPFEFLRVRTVEDVISSVFPDYVFGSDPVKLFADIDLDQEISNLNRQYEDYLIPVCIQNAESLVGYINKKIEGRPTTVQGTDNNQGYLFHCYWKLGASYCHLGDSEKSEHYFKKADEVFKKSKGAIDRKKYLQSLNNYAVLLKDVFLYKKAENQHEIINKKMVKSGVEISEIGKNFSSMSQLYMAQGKFDKAEKFQLEALKKIDSRTNHRNYGYLAQIYTRSGQLKKAKNSLKKAKNQIESSPLSEKEKKFQFYHWIKSEYLYSKVTTLKRKPRDYIEQLNGIVSHYPEIQWYVPGLIYKFCGLGLMLYGRRNYIKGLAILNKSQLFFDNQSNPVLKLLGVTVRLERLLTQLNSPIISLSMNQLTCDLEKIKTDLSVEKNIRNFFKKDLAMISTSLKRNSMSDININALSSLLQRINEKIPY